MKKIVIRVEMTCEKCRRKAMKIAAALPDVRSISVKGDQLEVEGDGVDPVCLMNMLRKKFRHANLETVLQQEVEANDDEAEQGSANEEEEEEEEEREPTIELPLVHYYDIHSHYLPPPNYYQVVYDSYPGNCSIQ